MDLKKHFKLKEEEVPFSERDKDFYQSLLKDVEANGQARAAAEQPKKKVSFWAWLTPLATALVAVIVLTCIFIPHNDVGKLYSDEDLKSETCTVSDMYSNLNFISLNSSDYDIERTVLTFDSKSNDKLYYSFDVIDGFSKANFVIVINANYNYSFEIIDEVQTAELENYSVTYSHTDNLMDAMPNIEYRGWIKVKTETVYFEYVQRPALGEQAFFESIGQIIQVKA